MFLDPSWPKLTETLEDETADMGGGAFVAQSGSVT